MTDYTSVVNREILFRSGESAQCTQVSILDDRNVLEESMETFQVTLSATETVVIIPFQHENMLVNIVEDNLDGSFKHHIAD